MDKSNKPKLQFSQKVCLSLIRFGAFVILSVLGMNFILSWFDKQTLSDVAIVSINVFGGIMSTGAFGGYLALSGIRDCSLNKHGVNLHGASEQQGDGDGD